MRELELFVQSLESHADAVQSLRRSVLSDAGAELLATVQSRIGGTGRVQSWQETRMGSGGGYAAVRPKAKTWDEHRRAVGAVTTAIEYGHAPGYHQSGRVAGKYMYTKSGPDAERLAYEAADTLSNRIAEELER